MKYFIRMALLAVLCAGALQSCRKTYDEIGDCHNRKVFIFYAAGFNNLNLYIQQDLADMVPTLPKSNLASKYKVLVVSQTPTMNGNYYTPVAPVIYDYYRDEYGIAVRDTLYRFATEDKLTDVAVMKKALEYIKEKFPAKEYGLCVSSHGSGWLPDDYYTFPIYDNVNSYSWNSPAKRKSSSGYADPVLEDYFGDHPTVKSMLAHNSPNTTHYGTMNIPEFASAIPFKLDYILFDMCLTGCVEVAYQLRNVAGKVAYSSMEVMSDGFQYSTLLDHLLYSDVTDLKAVCEDTYNLYLSAYEPYCTISLVDCSRMTNLANVCKDIIANHRESLDAIDAAKVQRFYRNDRHFFYDLQDILVKAGATGQEQTALQDALDECVVYKAATQWGVYKEFKINTFCGMSMFIPSNGSTYLQNYYKEYDWNEDTSLVK